MTLKLRKFFSQFSGGLVTGVAAHIAAHAVVFSGERLAHFLGHVVAVALLKMLY